MTYTSQGLMTPADLADQRVLTDTHANPDCPGHEEDGMPFPIYCSACEDCPAAETEEN